ncbi:glycosyltransferase family 2 protein [Flavobacterium sp. N2038]|uniref:glycosyltransferase family 2 protein n=1 Tax=Flavobacterium sp. N2038 TaxID=2986829 RepID=UPI00222475E7|nr:glycosyltransferase family 2 protein [Flavobacterium sp. N2038]
MNPLVSIIIPCYNQGKFINETLQSVYLQTYITWECIIVNDGSTDNTEEIAKSWEAKDSRFKYYYKKNSGVSSTRNFGISKASGMYLQFLDSDDLLDEKKIQFSVDEILKSDEVKKQVVISNFKMISANSKEILPPFCELTEKSFTLENFLYNLFSIQLQCGFFDIKLFENIKFPENLSAQEDWIVWIAILKTNPGYSFIDLPLAYYRINPSGRMNTIGADDNQIKILDPLKQILTYDEYYKFSVDLMTRYFNSAKLFRNNLNAVKRSKSYQSGILLKKGLKKIGVLKIGQFFFKRVIKFKTKEL